MSIVAVSGDAATTTSVVLAASWSAGEAMVVEADQAGGDLAAWFDLPAAPSLSTLVTRVRDGQWSEIEHHLQSAPNGLRVLPAPARAIEAARAVSESMRSLVPTLASRRSIVAIADCGHPAATASHPFLGAAAVHVVVHRQTPHSARAAAVRLQRLDDDLESRLGSPTPLVVAVIGRIPFDVAEIAEFLSSSSGSVTVVALPEDVLTASVIAGRTGVSPRRFARLPLSRAGVELADSVAGALASVGAAPEVAR